MGRWVVLFICYDHHCDCDKICPRVVFSRRGWPFLRCKPNMGVFYVAMVNHIVALYLVDTMIVAALQPQQEQC